MSLFNKDLNIVKGSTTILKKTTVPMWKRQKCTRALRTRITEAQICAGATGNEKAENLSK